jgi:hypothetical protein
MSTRIRVYRNTASCRLLQLCAQYEYQQQDMLTTKRNVNAVTSWTRRKHYYHSKTAKIPLRAANYSSGTLTNSDASTDFTACC